MIPFLTEWALRSSILIASGGLLLAVLRVKDSSVRLAGWTAMLAGSFLIPAMIAILPAVPLRVFRPQPPAPARMTQSNAQQAFESFVTLSPPPNTPSRSSFNPASLVLAAYSLIAALMLLRLLTGLLGSLRLLRHTHPTARPEFRESASVNSPVTLGLIRPLIVLPTDWPQWESTKLRAVLAHENAHIRRRDPLVQFVSAIHRAFLWFSPLAWLLHSRIVAISEEASDDAALSEMSEPAVYAELLLDFMQRLALRSKQPGIPMARYGRADRRIHRILESKSFPYGLTRWSVATLLVVAAPLTYLVAVSRASAQAAPPVATPRPKFDVASIKLCDPGAARAGGRGGKGSAHFRRNCITVRRLIEDAYIRFVDGTDRSPMLTPLTKIEGGPAWLDSDQYTIEAESETASTPMMMDGPMMQTLLEDRFQLRVHRETREGPIYELVVAKGGSKLLPAKQGPCIRSDFADSSIPYFDPPPGAPHQQCSFFLTFAKGPNRIMAARNTAMEGLAAELTRAMDRLVVDKTGITEKVDFRMVYSGDDPSAAEFEAAPILTAIQQQLGLKLEPARGPRDYLVIDSISRPSSN